MKIKQLNELKQQEASALHKKAEDLEKEIVKIRIELNMGKIKNVHSIKNKKKEIAQIKTVINMKNLTQVNSNIDKQNIEAKP